MKEESKSGELIGAHPTRWGYVSHSFGRELGQDALVVAVLQKIQAHLVVVQQVLGSVVGDIGLLVDGVEMNIILIAYHISPDALAIVFYLTEPSKSMYVLTDSADTLGSGGVYADFLIETEKVFA